MNRRLAEHTLIENQEGLEKFYNENTDITWLGFDTEFIGEKRYYTLLCLIQIVTANGIYLIDTLKVDRFDGFLDMLTDPSIIKITHAGENDYRLLNSQFEVTPVNLFDVQIAAGFVGYKFPISFQKLLDKELGVHISKGYTVSDWKSRPINNKQLQYALNDVIYLHKLWTRLSKKLNNYKRMEWAKKEFSLWEKPAFYQVDPHKEAFANSLIFNLNVQEQVFLIRLYEWRRATAERKNYSKDMILQSKYIAGIVRNIRSGKAALKNHRRIPDGIINQHWETFNKLYQTKISPDERELLKRIPEPAEIEANNDDQSMEILHLLIKYKCNQHRMAHDLLLYRVDMKKMKLHPDYFDTKLETGWRKEFLGEGFIEWIKERSRLEIDMDGEECIIRLRSGEESK
ncbi:MAG: ribonuclease D [Bacteroidota bacterium]